MKNILVLFVAIFFINASGLNAQSKLSQELKVVPFQGLKEFCSITQRSKYKVLIQGTKATITYLYEDHSNKLAGTFKNGKLYTNDPYEVNSKNGGKYYLITKSMIRILNIENGDYDEYGACK